MMLTKKNFSQAKLPTVNERGQNSCEGEIDYT